MEVNVAAGKGKMLPIQLFLLLLSLFVVGGIIHAEENATTNIVVETQSEEQQQGTRGGRVFVPGDAVYISNFPDTTSFLNNVFPIDDRGYIDLPIYGRAKITGMSENELVNFLRTNFKDYLRFSELQVRPLIRVSVLGGVALPGLYFVDPNRSLWDVFHLAGGTLDEDGLQDSKWKRDGKDVEDNLIPILQKGVSLRSIGFRSGDQVWVKSPDRPGFFEKFQNATSLVTLGTSVFTIYLTYEALRRSNR